MPSPKDTHGPVVKTGPTTGQNRSRTNAGFWRRQRSDSGHKRHRISGAKASYDVVPYLIIGTMLFLFLEITIGVVLRKFSLLVDPGIFVWPLCAAYYLNGKSEFRSSQGILEKIGSIFRDLWIIRWIILVAIFAEVGSLIFSAANI